MNIYVSNLIIRRSFSRICLWKTWSDVWAMMVVEEGLAKTWPRWTMHQRRANRSLDIEIPDVMEKGKWMFNPRNQSSHEESHISKYQSLLNQGIKWLGDQKWKLIIWFEVFQVTTSKSWCQSNITCDNCDRTTSKRSSSLASTWAILIEARTQSTHISTISYIEVEIEVITT
jgi:hypothetical protein